MRGPEGELDLPVPKTMTSYSLAISSMSGGWGVFLFSGCDLSRVESNGRWCQWSRKARERKVVDSRSRGKGVFESGKEKVSVRESGGYKKAAGVSGSEARNQWHLLNPKELKANQRPTPRLATYSPLSPPPLYALSLTVRGAYMISIHLISSQLHYCTRFNCFFVCVYLVIHVKLYSLFSFVLF